MTSEQIQAEREAEWREEDKEFYRHILETDFDELERQGLEKLCRKESGV
jgi:hypothetical protein